MKKLFFILFIILNFCVNNSKSCDLIVYSYKRPMQLYAFLESVQKYITNLNSLHVIYRADNTRDCAAYDIVKAKFVSYKFNKQGDNPHGDFKLLTVRCLNESSGDYIMFAVDDIIVKDFIDLSVCMNAMAKTKAYGFYLRLGFNITESYMYRMKTPIPAYRNIIDDIYMYRFNSGTGDWSYPNTVDMTIYNKKDVLISLSKIGPHDPFSLELHWTYLADLNQCGLFFKESKIVNIPVNLCYENSVNRSMKLYSTKDLFEKFKAGFKIDISKFYKINNSAPHAEYVPEFIKTGL